MSAQVSVATQFNGLTETEVIEALLSHQPDVGPFVRWHLRRKFRVMAAIFRTYMAPNTRFLDMACGTGDGLVLASVYQPESEIWGLDIYPPDLEIAKARTPHANLVEGDMLNPDLPREYFDVVHEFGAACMVRGWDKLAKVYLSLLREGGILLWELPQKWSTAHVSYMLSVAPKITAADTKFRRILRSFLPSKYAFESDAAISQGLEAASCVYEILEKVPIWHFYYGGLLCGALDLGWKFGGDGLFDWLDKATSRVWPRYAGYYLVIRKKGPAHNPR